MLTKRLAACAALVTEGGVVCDVGTDHAYLPAGDGVELFRFRPADMEGVQTFDIPCEGGYNTIAVEGGEVCVSAADCPDQTCVQMGKLRSRALPIVCLPHRLTIRFVDGGGDGLDAVAR